MSSKRDETISAAMAEGTRPDRIFVRDYVIDCNIGVYAEEKGVTQKVRLTVEASLAPTVRSSRDEMAEVPSYTDLIDAIHAGTENGHINLVETFAERIAARCLQDPRIVSIVVCIEKLERGPVRGVEIVRRRGTER
ncbi:MAG: dihydroneopterin aldolase [Hyphomicrobium sp.]